MTVDLTSLFQPRERVPKFASVKAELEAISTGAKPMSAFLFPDEMIGKDEFFHELITMASEFRLLTALKSKQSLGTEMPVPMSYMFVYRSDETWRVPAYLLMKRICEHYGWSDAAEHLEGSLLGYTDEEIGNWLVDHASIQAGWIGRTFLMLVPVLVADGVRDLGNRSINAGDVHEPILAFFHRQRCPLKHDANVQVPRTHELLRVAVKEWFFNEIFDGRARAFDDDVIRSTVHKEAISRLNSAIQSNFQFYGAAGWK